MFSSHPTLGAVATTATATVKATPLVRVASITIDGTTFESIAEAEQVEELFKILDRCVVQAEQRAHFGSDSDIPAALVKIQVRFPGMKPANASILGPLTTDYPALVRSLQVLTIVSNAFDESAALGAFAELATRLQELTFLCCGLTSVQGLEGRCEFLRTVNLRCCAHLTRIDALGGRVYLRQRLEEVNASYTGITSVDALSSCPHLTKLDISYCWQLSSMDALASHHWLKEVNASYSGITSIEPLRSCAKLTKVNLIGCELLSADVSLPASVTVRQQW